MRLRDLIQNLPAGLVKGNLEQEITGISYDSRKARPGDLFVCIPGTKTDGHNFIKQARDRGVVAFLVSREAKAAAEEAMVVVEEPRLFLGILASRLAGEPSRKMELIGITGTNGKTTTSYLIEAISSLEGRECGVIGTINYRWKGSEIPATNTTPESLEIIEILNRMLQSRVKRVAMEISSHALDQKRVSGIRFCAGIFTNLTPEHLDYHRDLEDYFRAKSLLFLEVLPGKWLGQKNEPSPISIINLDDPYGRRLFRMAPGKKVGYGLENNSATYRAKILEHTWNGIKLQIIYPAGEMVLTSPLLGRINAYNILAAAGALMELGTKTDAIARGVENLKTIPGRLERVENEHGFLVLVDYAHTPDALEKAIATVKTLGIKRLILVFGCGGDRDRTKRPKMGEIGAQAAEILIITSDNPRTEDPLKIISEIEPGIEKTGMARISGKDQSRRGYLIEPDRRSAISIALSLAGKGDCVLIAGKGHEDYQILGAQKIHFDDREEVRKILGSLLLT